MKQIKIYPSMLSTLSVGWLRDDLPMVHVFAQAEPGAAFRTGNGNDYPHWPCAVCEAHGYTEADFGRQMLELMAKGPSA